MTDALGEVVRRHQSGEAAGITSVCSAHPLVLRAAVTQAVDDGTAVLGGDDLGPNAWRDLPAVEAMRWTEELVADPAAPAVDRVRNVRGYAAACTPEPPRSRR